MTHDEFLSWVDGQHLYGNDFTGDDLVSWYRDEEEGYSGLIGDSSSGSKYNYHQNNEYHGWSRIRSLPSGAVGLGIGSAKGLEFSRRRGMFSKILIVEASDKFRLANQDDGMVYMKANISGHIDLPDNTVDLITCLGVLHHIPNVSYIICEMGRVLKYGGYALIREPIVSMGDWNKPRPGLTKRERGIPLPLFREFISKANLTIFSERLTTFGPLLSICRRLRVHAYDSALITRLDFLLARLFTFNYSYHSESFVGRLRPTAVYYVLKKASV